MQTTDRTTINEALNRDHMVNLHSFRATGVDGQQGFLVNPFGSAAFNVLSAVSEARRAGRIGSPSKSAGSVPFGLVKFVKNLFLFRDLFSVRAIRKILFSTPVVLVIGVSTEVFAGPSSQVNESAGLAFMADGSALFVVVGSRFVDAAGGADLERKRFLAGFHNSDIVARGDSKLREFGGRLKC